MCHMLLVTFSTYQISFNLPLPSRSSWREGAPIRQIHRRRSVKEAYYDNYRLTVTVIYLTLTIVFFVWPWAEYCYVCLLWDVRKYSIAFCNTVFIWRCSQQEVTRLPVSVSFLGALQSDSTQFDPAHLHGTLSGGALTFSLETPTFLVAVGAQSRRAG